MNLLPTILRFKLLAVISLMSLFNLTTIYANDCDNLQITTTLNSIKIQGLSVSIEILKVYDNNWNKIFECNNDCNSEILLENLSSGDYHIDLQAFDKNWNELCKKDTTVIVGGCICPALYMPVCGVDGNTYDNACLAACAGVEIAADGECNSVTTCDLLTLIDLNPNLCDQCLTEVAIYSLDSNNYLVLLADHKVCSDGLTTVLDCETGEEFCLEGGIAGFSCGNFFKNAKKTETILQEDCSPCVCTDEYAPVCGTDGKTYSNACEAACAGVEIVEEGECLCPCPAIILPVCGVDGNTYTNDCLAACAGVEVAFEGTCEECIGEPVPNVFCTKEYAPVCGCDGNTYPNACYAEVAGVKSWTRGECDTNTDCFQVVITDIIACQGATTTLEAYTDASSSVSSYEWNTGDTTASISFTAQTSAEYSVTVTYENACTSTAIFGIDVQEKDSPFCIDNCLCTKEYQPVCGVDGNTYDNACLAACAGVAIATEGACDAGIDCDLLTRITFNPDLCAQCLSEIAVYAYQGSNYLVFLGDNFNCADVPNQVLSCDTGDDFCIDPGFPDLDTLNNCEPFFEEAVKIATILESECNECKGLPTPGAPCPEFYEPVCGCDGATYTNACTAQSSGIKQWTAGKCPQNETIKCEIATIHYGEGKIKMTAEIEGSFFFKIYDQNNDWKEVYNCSFQCASEQIAELPAGKYYVKIYDSEWSAICENEVILEGTTNTQGSGLLRCGDATITYGEGEVTLTGTIGNNYHLKIFDNNYQDVFACMWHCGEVIHVTDLPEGNYFIQVFDGDYQLFCEEPLIMETGATIREHLGSGRPVTLFPNPAAFEVFITIKHLELAEGFLEGQLRVFNAFGKEMTAQKVNNNAGELIRLDVKDYQNGLYFYQIEFPKEPVVSGKFMVSRMY